MLRLRNLAASAMITVLASSNVVLAQTAYGGSNPWEIDKNKVYQDGYNQGYASGSSHGQQTGYSQGSGEGYARGANEGYQLGHTHGTSAGDGIGYQRGYSEGTVAGYEFGYPHGENAGYSRGYAAGNKAGDAAGQIKGFNDGMGHCLGDPAACGITVAIALPDAEHGETEPNDHIIAADPLVLDVPFWGQAYGAADTDWFYLETTKANQVLNINFAVPGATVGGWLINVRDAAGNIYAAIDTTTATTSVGEGGDINYKVTLGLAGTYYIEVKSAVTPVSPNPYTLAAMLQDSPLDSGNFQVGFYDAEVEPNDWPTTTYANPLATGVTMYGLVNLTFDVAIPQGSEYVWAQGEPDWFVYTTNGNEIVTLTFCAKEDCGPGDWFVDVYDAAGAARLMAGESEQTVDPVLAFNTNTDAATDGEPETIRFGLMAAGTYFMRVNHKRLFTAPCTGYETDWDNDGLPSGPPGAEDQPAACACTGGYSCSKTVKNPVEIVIEDKTWPWCPWTFFTATEQCQAECSCEDVGGVRTCSVLGDSGTSCSCPGNVGQCGVFLPNPGTPAITETIEYDVCPDGSGGGTDNQCDIGCVCTAFGGVVEVPEGPLTGQYNFTWYGTKLPPFTFGSGAYNDFLNR